MSAPFSKLFSKISNNSDEGGVWRTVMGRKVFIKDGQSAIHVGNLKKAMQAASGGSSNVDHLESLRKKGKAVKTESGYKVFKKHGVVHHDKKGNITTFEPKMFSHEKRFSK